MRVLFDVVHPAHVLCFSHAIRTLMSDGAAVLVTSRHKDVTVPLLDALGVEHEPLSAIGKGRVGLFSELAIRNARLLRRAKAFDPDVIVGCNSPCGAQVAWMMGRPSIVFEDTEVHRHSHLLYYPVVTEVHSPRAYRWSFGDKHFFYAGYHSLAHLAPTRFTPNADVMRSGGLEPGKYVFVRFVAWGADHDRHAARMSTEERTQLVRTLEELGGPVVLSSEGAVPPELAHLVSSAPVRDIHHYLAHARLVIGESATMSTEASVLGTPAIFIDANGRGFTDDLERRYGLCSTLPPTDLSAIVRRVRQVLEQDRQVYSEARARLLAESVDLASYQVEAIRRVAHHQHRWMRVWDFGALRPRPRPLGTPAQTHGPDG